MRVTTVVNKLDIRTQTVPLLPIYLLMTIKILIIGFDRDIAFYLCVMKNAMLVASSYKLNILSFWNLWILLCCVGRADLLKVLCIVFLRVSERYDHIQG